MAQLFNQEVVFSLLGGLGLFLYGVKMLTDGLQQASGEHLRKILTILTRNRFSGAMVGFFTTALLQASSATTIMVIGFVNAGLLSLGQGISVVLGANLGTTLTSQLLAYQIGHLALPVIALGALLKLFSRKPRWQTAGEMLLGCGILFLALAILKDAFALIRGDDAFQDVLLALGKNTLVWVLIGSLLTMATQSAAATIGVAISMATAGVLSLEASIALILGENIGSAITTNVAAVGTSLAARRTALSHLVFNGVGVILFLSTLPVFLQIVATISPGDANFVIQSQDQVQRFGGEVGDRPFIARHIANSHLLLNLINLALFLPLVGLLGKTATLLIRGREKLYEAPIRFIDTRVLNTPPIALSQTRSEVLHMMRHTSQILDETFLYLQDGNNRRLASLAREEESLDLLQREITDFLAALSRRAISAETSRSIVTLMQVVNDLELIGDHCEQIWLLEQQRREQKVVFSPAALAEIKQIGGACRDFFHLVATGLDAGESYPVSQARERVNLVERLVEASRTNHITRLGTGECAVQPGLIFNDMLHNFEKVAAHTCSIAVIAGEVR